MDDGKHELCWKCESEIDRERVIDFTLKNGKRVCEQCFVRETPWPELIRTSVESGSQKWRTGGAIADTSSRRIFLSGSRGVEEYIQVYFVRYREVRFEASVLAHR
jgi:hypothetical protein